MNRELFGIIIQGWTARKFFQEPMNGRKVGGQLSQLEQKTVAKLMKHPDRVGKKAGEDSRPA